MSAAGVPLKSQEGTAPVSEPTGPAASGAELAQDFKQTYGSSAGTETATGAGAPPSTAGQPGQRFNSVTQKWEDENAHTVMDSQNGVTGPETADPADGGREPTFMERVAGQAKVFRGKTFGQEHEVAKGEALLSGAGIDKAKEIGAQVKQQQQ